MKCLSPRFSSQRNGYVPCNQCYYCRTRKKFEWTARVMLERFSFKNGFFITLTYNDVHLPQNKGVSYSDADAFIDNLRRFFHRLDLDFSFYLMSEYGGISKRPHYHMHFFCDADIKTVSDAVYRYWNKGFVKFGRTTFKSVLYTSAFHLLPKEHLDSYPVPNFHIFTRGLGSKYFDDPNIKSFYLDNEKTTIDLAGRVFGLPPYIKKKIGLVSTSTLRDLNLFELKNSFYLSQIEKGFHSNIYKSWELFVNSLNSKLILKGLKNKI